MATCTQTVICECGRLGCIICRKITLYYLQDEFYFLLHCLGYVGHDLHHTQTYQNLDNFGHSCCICHLSVLYDMVYI